MTGPFEGVRVLEVASWTFVPAAGAAMADLGADVIKVEPPDGDPQRGLMNLLGRPDGSGPNPFVEIPNRGKRGMTIDLTTEQGRDVLLELATTADVFLTSYLPAVRKRLGIELDDLRRANQQIIYTCGHGWGARGPMKDTGGFDLAAGWASAGMASKMTRPGQEPMFQPAAFFDLQGANTIAGAIGTALFQRERTGIATEVDVSLLGVGIWTLSPDIMAGPFVGSMPAPDRTRAPNPLTNSYPTSDGRWLYLVCLQADRFWAELCAAIGRPELVSDERFGDMVVRAQNAEACVSELERTFASESLEHWRTRLADFTGVWSPALTPVEVHEHVQVEANGYLPEVVGHDGATFRLPARLPCSSAASRRCPPLRLLSSGSTPRRSSSNWGTVGTPSTNCASPAHWVELIRDRGSARRENSCRHRRVERFGSRRRLSFRGRGRHSRAVGPGWRAPRADGEGTGTRGRSHRHRRG